MKKLQISVGCCNYDRTVAVLDGRAPVEGCEVIPAAIEPEEAFHRAFRFAEFDVSELSLSSHTMMTSRGQNDYVGIPAFVSRLFRHSGIYIRDDRGIQSPADLRGKVVGLPEYQITANVWIRGIMKDDYGLEPASVQWRRGGVEEAGRLERAPLKLPAGIDLQQVRDDGTLSSMLESGELDAVISARAPSCYTRGAPHVKRMFEDYPAAEADYFRRTGIFPIMHIIGIRKTLAEQNPWLPVSLLKSFMHAKDLCMEELGQIGHLFNSLPWGVAAFEQAKQLMGEDYWSYGFEANHHVLDTFCRYHFEQGLSERRIEPKELFTASSQDLTKI